jgi:hypothetical protein
MAYFRKYTASFVDIHNIHPARWRVDILDDEGSAGDVPLTLMISASPLTLERIDTSDDKSTIIIGQQAVFQYVYTGIAGEPEPEVFFDVDERRFRMEVYKNDVLYEVFYIKPDAQSYQDKLPPYTVTLTAVDGLSFIKSVPWNAYTDGLLDYRWMSLYEIIADRGLLQILDDGTTFNTINTLRPDNITGDETFLNDLYMHSDMFYDFVKGPNMVSEVLEKICQAFNCRLFIAQNQVWIIRISDLNAASIVAENYINSIYNSLPLPTIFRTIGPSEASNDATSVSFSANNLMFPAIKRVEYELSYRGINRLSNFIWEDFDGTDFSDWRRQTPLTVSRRGTGTIEDPYQAFLDYVGEQSPENVITLSQGSTGTHDIFSNIGDVYQCAFKYQYFNTSTLNIAIYGIDTVTGETIALESGGEWQYITGAFPPVFTLGRSGNKPTGSFSFSSKPMPAIIQEHPLSGNPFQMFYAFYAPTGLNTLDGAASPGIAIYPVKLSIYPISSAGRSLTDINNARFSQVKDSEEFNFMDTGVVQVSNTISVSDTGVAAKNWSAALDPDDISDIEKHMADGTIDQYAKSVAGWESPLKSNTIQFWHIFTMGNKPGKKYLTMRDKYEVKGCIHDIGLQEILPENGASTTYSETDIEDQ